MVLLLPVMLFAQEKKSKYNIGDVEVDILNSYYEQDGNHSAVEGGEGTQYLTDFVNSIKINIPIDSVNTISLDASYDTYTSASSKMVYGWEVTGASIGYKDQRTYSQLHYARIVKNNQTLSVGGGFSNEYDVMSLSVNGGWQKSFNSDNHIVGIDFSYIHDNWKLIYPVGINIIQSENGLQTNVRNTLGINASYSFVVNKKMQAQLVYNLTLQKGLLSTPFHRIYFDTTGYNIPIIEGNEIFSNIKRTPFNTLKDIERLPNEKYKNALGFRSSNYVSNWLIIRSFYRYYFDSFGIKAHTASVEIPIKPNRFLSFYPFYRYHIQTAAKYFAPFLSHSPDLLYSDTEAYYTSDYDLSAFHSHKYGLGIKFSPPLGIKSWREMPFKQRTSSFKSVELRFGQYIRSDGLKAFIVSSGLSFSF